MFDHYPIHDLIEVNKNSLGCAGMNWRYGAD